MYPVVKTQDGAGDEVHGTEEVVLGRNPSAVRLSENPLIHDVEKNHFWDLPRAMQFKTALRLQALTIFAIIITTFIFKATEASKILHIIDDTLSQERGEGFDIPPLRVMFLHELPGTLIGMAATALVLKLGYTGMTKRSSTRMGVWNFCACCGVAQALVGIMFCIAALTIFPSWTELAVECDAHQLCMPDGRVTPDTLSCIEGVNNEMGTGMPGQCRGLDHMFLKCPHHEHHHHHHPRIDDGGLQPYQHAPFHHHGHHTMHHFVAHYFVDFPHPHPHPPPPSPMAESLELRHRPSMDVDGDEMFMVREKVAPMHPPHDHHHPHMIVLRLIRLVVDPYNMHHHVHEAPLHAHLHKMHGGFDHNPEESRMHEIEFCKSDRLRHMFGKNHFCCKKYDIRCELVHEHRFKTHFGSWMHKVGSKHESSRSWCASGAQRHNKKKNEWCCKTFQLRCEGGCNMEDGSFRPVGWSGPGVGANFCNTCTCEKPGLMSCTEMGCGNMPRIMPVGMPGIPVEADYGTTSSHSAEEPPMPFPFHTEEPPMEVDPPMPLYAGAPPMAANSANSAVEPLAAIAAEPMQPEKIVHVDMREPVMEATAAAVEEPVEEAATARLVSVGVKPRRLHLMPETPEMHLWEDHQCKVNVEAVNNFHIYVLAQPRLEREVYLNLFAYLTMYVVLLMIHGLSLYTGIHLRREIQTDSEMITIGAEHTMYPMHLPAREVPLVFADTTDV